MPGASARLLGLHESLRRDTCSQRRCNSHAFTIITPPFNHAIIDAPIRTLRALFACALTVLISSFAVGCFRQRPRRRREYRREYRQHLQELEKGNKEAPPVRLEKGRHLLQPTLRRLRALTAGKQQRAERHQGQLPRRLRATLPLLNRVSRWTGIQNLEQLSTKARLRPHACHNSFRSFGTECYNRDDLRTPRMYAHCSGLFHNAGRVAMCL